MHPAPLATPVALMHLPAAINTVMHPLAPSTKPNFECTALGIFSHSALLHGVEAHSEEAYGVEADDVWYRGM